MYFAINFEATPDTLAALQSAWMEQKSESYPGRALDVAGRKTLIGPSLGTSDLEEHSCSAETVGRAWPHGFGNDATSAGQGQQAAFSEVPSITLSDDALSVHVLCAAVTSLAYEAWPKLAPLHT